MGRIAASALVGVCVVSGSCWLDAAELEQARARVGAGEADADVDADSDTDVDADADTDADADVCADQVLIGSIATGTTVGSGDDSGPGSCASAGGGGADFSLAWEAPSAGCWIGSTDGSAFDTVLVAQAACTGAEIACDDDGGEQTQSAAWLPLDGPGSVLWIVDGYGAADEGAWTFSVVPAPLDVALGSALSGAGDTSNADTTWAEAPCVLGSTGKDQFVTWTAPSAGTWRFDLSAGFDAVLTVHPGCAPTPLDCSDQAGAGGETVTVVAAAGESFRLRVGGWGVLPTSIDSGPWSLAIVQE